MRAFNFFTTSTKYERTDTTDGSRHEDGCGNGEDDEPGLGAILLTSAVFERVVGLAGKAGLFIAGRTVHDAAGALFVINVFAGLAHALLVFELEGLEA